MEIVNCTKGRRKLGIINFAIEAVEIGMGRMCVLDLFLDKQCELSV